MFRYSHVKGIKSRNVPGIFLEMFRNIPGYVAVQPCEDQIPITWLYRNISKTVPEHIQEDSRNGPGLEFQVYIPPITALFDREMGVELIPHIEIADSSQDSEISLSFGVSRRRC